MSPNEATRTPGAALSVRAITKRYGATAAVDAVDLEIGAGEFVTLLGASGSGKTTLLRIIAGFGDADEGSLLLDGQELRNVPVHKRDIGMVFQNYALFPHLSVEQNVAYPLRMRRVPSAERRRLVAEALEAVRLPEFGRRRITQLSGGQQQRVALARAIVSRPRLLLMDEPLGALDRNLRDALQLEISRLSRELGLTVINVTHDQEEALTMSDRIALLDHGRLVQFATPDELYHRPADDTAAAFVGESNLFRGHVRGDGTLEISDGVVFSPPLLVDGSAVGADPVAVMVRPSLVDIAAPGTAPEAHSRVDGTVRGIVYAGDSRKIIVRTATGVELISREDASRPTDVVVDARVTLHWSPRASVVTRIGAAPTTSITTTESAAS
ncbi:ABC transporter ATP-binding protein [Microbacterium sp. cf332]|uniref:ABC transporter ATP-binding protein n=1 Tax=Microbacterium sp. cf332 TaxID=1761804 RepID=UPI00088736F8|nr:ABC transporter ATP-binding protein [Microbacterium sp. cf332]SDQ57962.1 putative spermidine/putrescine transport system ATP-binding protein [Microbacterium sp. cf332]